LLRQGYVRDRPREFAETGKFKKEEVLQRFDRAVEIAIETVRSQSDEEWSRPYSAIGAEQIGNRFNMILQCVTHLDHHVGQMIYLSFQLREP
jgi:hypothetical protein